MNFVKSDRLGVGLAIGIGLAVVLNDRPTLAGLGVALALIFGLSSARNAALEPSRFRGKR